MMFAGRCGASVRLEPEDDPLAALFNEELGAVLQVSAAHQDDATRILDDHELPWAVCGAVENDDTLSVLHGGRKLLTASRTELQLAWSETSYRIQARRDNPKTAREEYEGIRDAEDPGLNCVVTFDVAARPATIGGRKPRVAILREQGVNSQYEMAAAFVRAGFTATDVHMSDLLEGRDSLDAYAGLIACGGFSYGDVLGGGGGWAKSILFNTRLEDQFAAFFARGDSFALGVCNGCQMLSHLKQMIPGAEHWPTFVRNRSEQFEARLNLVEIDSSPSIFLTDMDGCRLPIATSHGEGRVNYPSNTAKALAEPLVALHYVDNYGRPAEKYPANPNGSEGGICGLSSADGRVTIMMPHPERVARTVQNSWHPGDWADDGAWMRMFYNARQAVG